jgi:hypothetical protein
VIPAQNRADVVDLYSDRVRFVDLWTSRNLDLGREYVDRMELGDEVDIAEPHRGFDAGGGPSCLANWIAA